MTNAEARFNKSHIRKVYACLAVTCHLHFWQNDRDFLRATVVTRGWNGYRNKSQHRKLTLEKKILPPFQQGFEPATFQSRVRSSNHWAIPAPKKIIIIDRFYIALFSALKQTHCARMWFYSEWIALYSAFLNIHRSGATWNCCHLGAFCVHHTTMHHATSCKATYVRCMRV